MKHWGGVARKWQDDDLTGGAWVVVDADDDWQQQTDDWSVWLHPFEPVHNATS